MIKVKQSLNSFKNRLHIVFFYNSDQISKFYLFAGYQMQLNEFINIKYN